MQMFFNARARAAHVNRAEVRVGCFKTPLYTGAYTCQFANMCAVRAKARRRRRHLL